MLPLEIRLRGLAETSPDKFPTRGDNYWDRYSALVNFLRCHIYPRINAGLACLSKSPGIYTDHGGDHFDEVVRYAGELLEPIFKSEAMGGVVTPYDLYLLLAAIRIHDAGNIDGRERHAQRAYSILREAGAAACPDDYEATLISKIAAAHGGVTEGGDQDTIHDLEESSGFGPIICRPQMIAAVVRFADEICEHSNRASQHHIRAENLPEESRLFHFYADAVKQAAVIREQKAIRLKLVFDEKRLGTPYAAPKGQEGEPITKYLLDDAFDRIGKLDTERIYCNRYLPPELRTDKVDVTLEIVRAESVGGLVLPRTWKSKSFIIQDRGYPIPNNQWREGLSGMTGRDIAEQLEAAT